MGRRHSTEALVSAHAQHVVRSAYGERRFPFGACAAGLRGRPRPSLRGWHERGCGRRDDLRRRADRTIAGSNTYTPPQGNDAGTSDPTSEDSGSDSSEVSSNDSGNDVPPPPVDSGMTPPSRRTPGRPPQARAPCPRHRKVLRRVAARPRQGDDVHLRNGLHIHAMLLRREPPRRPLRLALSDAGTKRVQTCCDDRRLADRGHTKVRTPRSIVSSEASSFSKTRTS